MLVCAVDWKACRKELCHADAHVPHFPNDILQLVRTKVSGQSAHSALFLVFA